MKVRTRLNVIDGQVVCARSCGWKAVDECTHCAELTRIEHEDARTTVVCVPEIDRPLGSVLQDMVRA